MIRKKICRACGRNMNTTAVCGVCGEDILCGVVNAIKWSQRRMYIITIEPYSEAKFQREAQPAGDVSVYEAQSQIKREVLCCTD